jgi:Tfp pilus assembly protein FimT
MRYKFYKKSMTYLEVILTLIIISIMSSVSYPNYDDENIQVAADELIAQMKYMSYLALVQDNENINDVNFKAKLWQIRFHKQIYKEKVIAYSIFRDKNANSIADKNEFLYDNFTGKDINARVGRYKSTNDRLVNKSTFLNRMYGIDDLILSKNCRYKDSMKLMFDKYGKVYIGYNKPTNKIGDKIAHIDDPFRSTIISPSGQTCKITLKQNKKTADICVEVNTGYIYKCNQ